MRSDDSITRSDKRERERDKRGGGKVIGDITRSYRRYNEKL